MLSVVRLEKLAQLQKRIRYIFKDPLILNKALTHKSYGHEKEKSIKNNERLEFLGDSVLDLIVSVYIVENYSNYDEGILSKIRASVVKEQCLADLAKSISIGEYLLLGNGEEMSGGRQKNSLLANAFEALAAAVYLDSSFKEVNQIFLPLLLKDIKKFSKTNDFRDYKSELQEYTQNKINSIPLYKIIKEIGPDHNKIFNVSVIINKKVKGSGSGKTKKEAEQFAAKEALRILNKISINNLVY